ncbi:DUF3418 domain-containing protein, partial [Escherichia sp. R-CC3]
FSIFPGSGLFKKPPKWVMVAELVETSRLWGRIAARIDPEWVEPVAQHLIKRTYSEPHWERAQGAVMATEKVTVYGLPIVAARKVNYSQIDPALCRELFIRHALVEGDWQTRHAFFRENLKLRAEVEELEHKSRRRDILVDDETLGLVHQQQSLFYEQGVFAATYPGKINFMQIAAGFGLETCDLNNEADPQAALQEIINRPGPALIHVRIDAEEKVYPMVPPGAANTEMVGE